MCLNVRRTNQVHLGHVMEMVLQLMDAQGLHNVTAIFPIPHLKMGEIPFLGKKDAERPPHILYGPIRQFHLFKTKLLQLLLIQRNRIQVSRIKPEILNAGLYIRLFLFPVHSNDFTF
jgi:hypothetical protein